MKHFLYKTNDTYLCIFFYTDCDFQELYYLLARFVDNTYKYDDELPLYDSSTGRILTSSEGTAISKSAVSYPDNNEGRSYICLQFNLIK